MIGYLIVTRAAIVLWVNLAGMPVVPVFGLPEGREDIVELRGKRSAIARLP